VTNINQKDRNLETLYVSAAPQHTFEFAVSYAFIWREPYLHKCCNFTCNFRK